MRTRHLLALLTVALTVTSSGLLRADFNPQDVVAGFGSRTFSAATGSAIRETSFTFTYTPNIDAYAPTVYGSPYFFGTRTIGENGFYTFCVDANVQPLGSGTASLDYSPSTGLTRNDTGHAVNLGVAWLYTQYATGVLADFPYGTQPGNYPRQGGGNIEPGGAMLFAAIQLLMYGTTTAQQIQNSSNQFIQSMLAVNSNAAYWLQSYDLRIRNDYIGDYAVFVLNVHGGQDHLYIARADYGTTPDPEPVPEPAMLLLWTLGGMGLAGGSWTRKRRMMKLLA